MAQGIVCSVQLQLLILHHNVDQADEIQSCLDEVQEVLVLNKILVGLVLGVCVPVLTRALPGPRPSFKHRASSFPWAEHLPAGAVTLQLGFLTAASPRALLLPVNIHGQRVHHWGGRSSQRGGKERRSRAQQAAPPLLGVLSEGRNQ